MRVCGGTGSGVCFSLITVIACYWCGRLCFGKDRDRGFCLVYFSIFAGVRVVGLGFRVCSRGPKLGTYSDWGLSSVLVQVWDRHLEGQKNPDRLKRSIHVDRIGVHSTFVYMYDVLRVLMIWAN